MDDYNDGGGAGFFITRVSEKHNDYGSANSSNN